MQAYGLTLELTNETVDAYTGASLSIVDYIKAYQFENTFTIGVNEVSDKRISHEWTGQETILARLFSTANVFDAELEFITELNDDYSLKQITLNIYRKHSDDYQGIGEDKSGTIIRYGQGIEGITKTSDITELYTAIRPTGTDGLTLTSLGDKKSMTRTAISNFGMRPTVGISGPCSPESVSQAWRWAPIMIDGLLTCGRMRRITSICSTARRWPN